MSDIETTPNWELRFQTLQNNYDALKNRLTDKTSKALSIGNEIVEAVTNAIDTDNGHGEILIDKSDLLRWAEALGAETTKQVQKTFEVTIYVDLAIGDDEDEIDASDLSVEYSGIGEIYDVNIYES